MRPSRREVATDRVSILIADDFDSWRSHVRDFLQSRPEWNIVGEARDGAEAAQKAAELQPDLVILDIAMPGVNGIEAAGTIRSCSPKSKIIFLSEFAFAEIVDAAFRAGAEAYVNKSKAARELVGAIENAVSRVH